MFWRRRPAQCRCLVLRTVLILTTMFVCGCAVLPHAESKLVNEPRSPIAVTTIVEPCDVTLASTFRSPWRIAITEDKTYPEGAFPEDYFVLRSYSDPQRSTPDIEFPFESTYGSFELELMDLTGDHVEEIVLITGQGRGTSVRGELLRVFGVRGSQLKQLLEVPVSGYFGSGCTWWYRHDYVVQTRKRRSLEYSLLLRLEHDSAADCVPASLSFPSLIPEAQILEYAYDAGRDQMAPLAPDDGQP